MRSVGLKILKNKLSEYVRLAAAGEVVLVTDRDKVVAELGPPAYGRAVAPADAVLADLLRAGILTAPLTVTSAPPPRMPVASWEELLAELQADRSER